MIRLPHQNLPKTAQNQLNVWQNEINGIENYAKRVDQGKKAFARRNKSKNPTFRQVRQTLTQMCCGARRCGYCEDSVADEVEHIKPKDLYPEAVFVWENYLYACGQCNGGKNNKYAVFSDKTGQLREVARRRGAPVVEPQQGEPVLIDPRKEDPMDFLEIDLIDTFYFLPRYSLDSKDYQRADYTIEVLRLNDRDYLVEARKEAFYNYRARLGEYIKKKETDTLSDQLKPMITALQRMQHPTIWKEMQRQQQFLSELKELFDLAPEALTW